MTSAGLPGLLKWSVASSEASQKNGTTPVEPPQLEALAHLFGFNVGSNAESMAKSLQVAKNESGEYDLKTRIEACENFQILVEDLNNANNLHNIPQYKDGPRGLWTPLLALLDSEEPEIRSWAALCCHSAVQNNVETQEKLLLVGGIPKLVELATSDPNKDVRAKAISAISSALKNYPPALDTILASVPTAHKPTTKIDARDIDSVDTWVNKLKADLL